MTYIKRPTQEMRILRLLRERGKSGAMVYELVAPRPTGLGISQYGARILELRKKGHDIINKKPGHFVLEDHDMEDRNDDSAKYEVTIDEPKELYEN